MTNKELAAKFASKSWRVNTLYTIINKDGEAIQFKQNVLQRRVSENPARRKIILKARQFGFSTNEIVDMFDDAITKRNVTQVILAHEQDSIKKLFRIVQRLYKFFARRASPTS